jgi:hypothetical protein
MVGHGMDPHARTIQCIKLLHIAPIYVNEDRTLVESLPKPRQRNKHDHAQNKTKYLIIISIFNMQTKHPNDIKITK